MSDQEGGVASNGNNNANNSDVLTSQSNEDSNKDDEEKSNAPTDSLIGNSPQKTDSRASASRLHKIQNSSSLQQHDDTKLSGWLKLGGLGFRKSAKQVWFVYGDDTGKLYYYRQPQDLLPLGEIDLRNSSLTYDASNKDKPGLFEIR